MSGNIEYLKGKGFDANPQNINKKGRPRKQLAFIIDEIKELGYDPPSQNEIIEISLLMLSLTKDDLCTISKNEEYPMIMRILATRLIGNQGFETIEKIFDRGIGKPKQTTDLKSNGDSNNPLSSMTDKELITIIIE